MTRLLIVLALVLLVSGCSKDVSSPVEEKPPAYFCDIEEPRKFSQEEVDWRSVNAPWNLKKDYKTNLAWERECLPQAPE